MINQTLSDAIKESAGSDYAANRILAGLDTSNNADRVVQDALLHIMRAKKPGASTLDFSLILREQGAGVFQLSTIVDACSPGQKPVPADDLQYLRGRDLFRAWVTDPKRLEDPVLNIRLNRFGGDAQFSVADTFMFLIDGAETPSMARVLCAVAKFVEDGGAVAAAARRDFLLAEQSRIAAELEEINKRI